MHWAGALPDYSIQQRDLKRKTHSMMTVHTQGGHVRRAWSLGFTRAHSVVILTLQTADRGMAKIT